MHNNWIDHLLPIMKEYMAEFDGDPMDGDDVADLCEIIKAKINLHQGNITEGEYEHIMAVMAHPRESKNYCPECGQQMLGEVEEI